MDPLNHLAEELGSCSLVCKAYKTLADDELIWKQLCERHFFAKKKRGESSTWKGLYKERSSMLKEIHAIELSSRDISPDLVSLIPPFTLKYIGHDSEGGATVGAAQATKHLQLLPFGNSCINAYFEVNIDDAGEKGYVAVGIGLDKFPLAKAQPGWRPGSFGFHGDDGRLYSGSGWGPTWGPTFTSGDVIGCGVNFKTKQLFYTKNGSLIGTYGHTLQNLTSYYPIVGLHSHGEQVTLNFGREKFLFDIHSYGQDIPVDISELVDLTSAAVITKDWTSREDENPFAYMISRIEAGGAEQDKEFVEHVRDIVASLQVNNSEDLEIQEMFEMIRRLHDFLEQNRKEKMEWAELPEEDRPELDRMQYNLLQRDFGVLSNRTLPDTDPSVQQIINTFETEDDQDFLDEFSEEELAAMPVGLKRTLLLNEMGTKLVRYERAIAIRDLSILRNPEMADDHERVARIIQVYTPEMISKFELNQQKIAALQGDKKAWRAMCIGVIEDTIQTADRALSQLTQMARNNPNKKQKKEQTDNNNKNDDSSCTIS